MEAIEKQALNERIDAAIAQVKTDIAEQQDAGGDYSAGVRQAAKVYLTQLEGMRQFVNVLDVETAEEYVARRLATRSAERKATKKGESAYVHEQKKKTPRARR